MGSDILSYWTSVQVHLIGQLIGPSLKSISQIPGYMYVLYVDMYKYMCTELIFLDKFWDVLISSAASISIYIINFI